MQVLSWGMMQCKLYCIEMASLCTTTLFVYKTSEILFFLTVLTWKGELLTFCFQAVNIIA